MNNRDKLFARLAELAPELVPLIAAAVGENIPVTSNDAPLEADDFGSEQDFWDAAFLQHAADTNSVLEACGFADLALKERQKRRIERLAAAMPRDVTFDGLEDLIKASGGRMPPFGGAGPFDS